MSTHEKFFEQFGMDTLQWTWNRKKVNDIYFTLEFCHIWTFLSMIISHELQFIHNTYSLNLLENIAVKFQLEIFLQMAVLLVHRRCRLIFVL